MNRRLKRKWKFKLWWSKLVYKFQELKNYRSNKKLKTLLADAALLPAYEAERPRATSDATPEPEFLAAVRDVLTSAGVGRCITLVTVRAEYSDGTSQTYTYPGPVQLAMDSGFDGIILRINKLTPLPGTQIPAPVPTDGIGLIST